MPSRILIADDHDLLRRLIKREFENHSNWVCIEAENGQQAVVKATELKPEIIILDLVMPVMDGLTAAREIVKILPAVPILIHTVHFSEQLKCEAEKIGVREVLPKADISSLVRRWDCGLRTDPHLRRKARDRGCHILRSSIKGEVKKKHSSCGRSFSCFPAQLIERDLL